MKKSPTQRRRPDNQSATPEQRHIPQLYDRVFKCLMCLSNKALISFINGLFGTDYPSTASVSRPSPETIEDSLRQGICDFIISINGDPFLIETQIQNDRHMGLRIFQYIMNQGRREGEGEAATEDHVIKIKLPQARVIYWEPARGTPEKETIVFSFPDGTEYRYEAPSFKFPEHPVEELEEKGWTCCCLSVC